MPSVARRRRPMHQRAPRDGALSPAQEHRLRLARSLDSAWDDGQERGRILGCDEVAVRTALRFGHSDEVPNRHAGSLSGGGGLRAQCRRIDFGQ